MTKRITLAKFTLQLLMALSTQNPIKGIIRYKGSVMIPSIIRSTTRNPVEKRYFFFNSFMSLLYHILLRVQNINILLE